jgi:site-specific DNA-methyltransferase (adenine-specific)
VKRCTADILFPNRIYQMDCLKGLRSLKDQVGVIVTSPPYNIGKPYRSYHDTLPTSKYLDWMGRVAKACKESLTEDGSLFLNIGGKPSDPLTPLKVVQRFGEVLTLQNTIIWVKSIAISGEDIPRGRGISTDISFGHYQPVNGPAFLNGCFEYVFHFTRNGRNDIDKLSVGVGYQDKSNVGRWQGVVADRRDRGNTWFIPYETINESRPHPSTFPVKLPEMCIKLHGVKRARLVVDPFMGIGSTAVASARLGIPFIGFEVDPAYIRIAKKRISGLLK